MTIRNPKFEVPNSPDTFNGIDAMSKQKIKIPGDRVNKATAELPDEQRSAIRWLHAHGVENDMSIEDLAAAIRRDKNTLYQVFTGSHGASKENITQEILAYQRLALARRGARKLDYIETALTRKVWQLCEAALTYQRIAYIIGDSQTGKTTALKEYARTHNHGETIYVSMPEGGILGCFLAECAAALRMSPQQKEKELRRRICEAFDNRMLLIVDEAHQCFQTSSRRSLRHIRALEFIREIHDRSGCGVVISATNTLREEMESGTAKGVLTQLARRRLAMLQLPNVPTDGDLNTFAAAYGLEPAEGEYLDLQRNMIRDEALGMWLTLLRMAANRAARAKRTLAWADVTTAYNGLRQLESIKS